MADEIHRHRSSSILTQNFVSFYDKEKQQGTNAVGNPEITAAEYLPDCAQERHFTQDRVRYVLNQLYPPDARSDTYSLSDPVHIQQNYRRILAILLYIGKGFLLHLFSPDPTLDDNHLPLLDPRRFPGSEEDFEAFSEAQWKFHVPKISYRSIVQYDAAQILPYQAVDKLGAGNSGKAQLIQLHPSHNGLNPNAPVSTTGLASSPLSRDSNQESTNPHLFVLKVFHPQAPPMQSWLHEARNHVAVRTNVDLMKDGGIVDFYGCFGHGPTFGILLEFAPKGNLEQMLKTTGRPTTASDILDLWNSFFRLLTTLNCLRRMEHADGGIYQMCHFDIKPNNMLIFSGDSGRPFDIRFKLGDLGSSVHCPVLDDSPHSLVYTLQKQGTRTYGAPECYRFAPNSTSMVPLNYVRADADLWSYGCVASELATWIVRGPEGLRAYREGRIDAHGETWVDKDCFHNGYESLPWITTFHERLIDQMDSDPCNATVSALQLIDKYMLQFEPTKRKHPSRLMHEADSMMREVARNILGSGDMPPASLHSSVSTASDSLLSNVSGLNISHNGAAQADRFCETNPSPPPAQVSPPPDLTYSRDHLPQQNHSSATNHRDDIMAGKNHGRNDSAVQSPAPRQRTAPVPMPNYTQDTDAGQPHLRGGQKPDDSPRDQRKRFSAGLSVLFKSDDPVNSRSSLGLASHPQTPPMQGKRTKVPFLSVDKALVWSLKTKNEGWLSSKVLHLQEKAHEHYWRQLVRDLSNRDFLIIVDDSYSMAPYWDEVVECAGLLAFCTQRYDNNGIDLSFVFDDKKMNARKDKQITKLVQKKRPRKVPTGSTHEHQRANIHAVLGQVVDDYQQELGKQRSGAYPQETKKLVVFVLTNGLWSTHSDAKEPLTRLVQTLSAWKKPSNQIGVQFIRFGDDPDGRQRLEKLDDLTDLEMDLVDVEPWLDGNVWKMLLGSINKDFDFAEDAASPPSWHHDNAVDYGLGSPLPHLASPENTSIQASPPTQEQYMYHARNLSRGSNDGSPSTGGAEMRSPIRTPTRGQSLQSNLPQNQGEYSPSHAIVR